MKTETRKTCCIAFGLLVAFVSWTVAVSVVDVRAIGPQGSTVGFATINGAFHDLTGVHMSLYTITDWLGLVPFGFVMGSALRGLVQWIWRKHLVKVDRALLVLGGYYLAVLAAYLLFEIVVVNHRPVLIDGVLEASYPSSTTMLVMCVMPAAMRRCNAHIKHGALRRCAVCIMWAFVLFMVVGRLVSGVHWLSDIIGGALLSAGLVMLYHSVE